MKYLKTFNENFTSNLQIGLEQKYGIGDWIEDLKSFEWNRIELNYSKIKMWSDHFIGEGWCDKIMSRINKMFTALSKVDEQEIYDRMYDVYDEIPSAKDKWVMCAIAYGDQDNYDKPVKYKYNGLVSVPKKDEKDKLRILVHIIKEIVFPTLYIGGYPNYFLRQSDESYYTTEPKWQCQNFNIDDYKEMGIEQGVELDYKKRKATITSYDIEKKKKYSIEKIIDMYVPCVVIDIGNRDGMSSGTMNLKKLELLIDESLESILPALDYQEVVFDRSREDRKYDDDIDVYDYTVKILLNF